MSPTLDPVVFGPPDARSLQQLETCLTAAGPAAAQGVLCADHHPGYSMPIGGVIALKNAVMPAGVGYDIACGNCAVQTGLQAADVDVPRVMDTLWRALSFGVGRRNDERVDHPVIDAIARSPVKPQRKLLDLARSQLGTIGSGNHYVDLFEDRADGSLWIGVHFGSRGFGHRTASGFLALATGREFDARVPEGGMDSAPTILSLSQPLGQDYVAAMELAGEYAYAGREWVVGKVLSILGAREIQRVHNHHNFAWKEKHHGETLWVVRKGATPAFPGQRGFIGGTMGDDAVIVRGGGFARLGGRVVFDSARRRPRDEPQRSARQAARRQSAEGRPRRLEEVAVAAEGTGDRGTRRRTGRSAGVLQEAPGGARPAPGDDRNRTHAAPDWRRHGGFQRVRSVQGLKRRKTEDERLKTQKRRKTGAAPQSSVFSL